jgi:hypothetical protein
VVIKCHATCTVQAVLDALALEWADLYPRRLSDPRPDVNQLLRDYLAGDLQPESVELGPLSEDATMDMRRIAEDMILLFGLNQAVGEYRPMPYSARYAAGRMGWDNNGHTRANAAMRRMVKTGVIERTVDLSPRGGRIRGTATYQPPLRVRRSEGESVPVKATEGQPAVEVIDEPSVNGTEADGRKYVGVVTPGDRTLTGDGPVACRSGSDLDLVHEGKYTKAKVTWVGEGSVGHYVWTELDDDGEAMPF